MDASIRQALIDIVGEANFTEALMDLVSYSYDASDHDHRPDAAVWPSCTEQVSRILGLADNRRFPVIPRGAGTGLSGAAVPASGGVMLDLCRMNEIIGIHIADRNAVVQPGVVDADLQKALAPAGFFCPPDPASAAVCPIGGNVATNAGGMRAAKYGVTRDYVMALEVVLPDGRIMRTGTRCVKSVSGYDLTRLFVGSEGTLGVITEVTLKIHPKPLAAKTALAAMPDLKCAGKAVSQIVARGIVPSVLEIMDENTLRVLREHTDMELPDGDVMLLVETDGCTGSEADFQMKRIIEALKANGAFLVREAASDEEAEELWKTRRLAGSVAGRLRPNNVAEDVTVSISKLPELLTGISTIIRQQDLPFVIFGHAGDGNLHPRIMYDRTDPGQVERLERAVRQIFELACRLGGTLTGEHGIGLSKATYMPLEHDAVSLDVMGSIKKLFDPNNILNPGKMNLTGR